MKPRRALLAWSCCAAAAGPGQAGAGARHSARRSIEIRYSFTGAQLLLFGAILYPGGRVPRDPADIVVVLKGPVEPILVREKQKIAGIWMNADSNRFRSAPVLLCGRIVAPDRASWSMSAPPQSTSSACRTCSCRPAAARCPTRSGASRPACSTCARREGLYAEHPHGVEISEGVLYRARIAIPSQVPVGTYTAETFLIDRRQGASPPRPARSRSANPASNASSRWPRGGMRFLYGLAAVLLSLGLGWAAAALFRAPIRRRLSQILTRLSANPALTLIDSARVAYAMNDQPNLQQFLDEMSSYSETGMPRKRRVEVGRKLPPIGQVLEIAGSGSQIRMDAAAARRSRHMPTRRSPCPARSAARSR